MSYTALSLVPEALGICGNLLKISCQCKAKRRAVGRERERERTGGMFVQDWDWGGHSKTISMEAESAKYSLRLIRRHGEERSVSDARDDLGTFQLLMFHGIYESFICLVLRLFFLWTEAKKKKRTLISLRDKKRRSRKKKKDRRYRETSRYEDR